MAKYKVFENVLNEYVNHPTQVLVDEVEATSPEEAANIIRMIHPNKGSLTINGQQFEG
jgi:hypothetical protein